MTTQVLLLTALESVCCVAVTLCSVSELLSVASLIFLFVVLFRNVLLLLIRDPFIGGRNEGLPDNDLGVIGGDLSSFVLNLCDDKFPIAMTLVLLA